jgi:hypothetical protein
MEVITRELVPYRLVRVRGEWRNFLKIFVINNDNKSLLSYPKKVIPE